MTTVENTARVHAPAFVATAFRYSDHPPAMRRFLELLGLGVRVSHGDGWFEMHGRSGAVCVHGSGDRSDVGAPGGRTDLVMITPDAQVAADFLESQGIAATVWDEAFGRQATVTHPSGRQVWVNEQMSDFYGYRKHDPEPAPIDVVTVYVSDDFAMDTEFFARFAFAPDPDGADDWRPLRHGDRGAIGLHVPGSGRAPGWAGMSFETAEDLDAVAARLRSAGYEPSFKPDPYRIDVIDPDGQLVEVHPSPVPA